MVKCMWSLSRKLDHLLDNSDIWHCTKNAQNMRNSKRSLVKYLYINQIRGIRGVALLLLQNKWETTTLRQDSFPLYPLQQFRILRIPGLITCLITHRLLKISSI